MIHNIMRFKDFIKNENLWGQIPAQNPPSQPYWLKNTPNASSPGNGVAQAMPMGQRKMMRKKMKKN